MFHECEASMKKLSDKAVKTLAALLDVVGEHARGKRDNVNVYTEELNTLIGGPKVAFRDEAVLRECAEWCGENDLPLLTMMMSSDPNGDYPDQISSKLAFKHGVVPSRAEMTKAWRAEREEIAALDEEAVSAAKEALAEAVESLNASKAPSSRRALANARNQEIEGKSFDYWMGRYQNEVLDLTAPGQPLVRNGFLEREEGYKGERWDAWHEGLGLDAWSESMVGTGKIVDRIQPSRSTTSGDLRQRLAARSTTKLPFHQWLAVHLPTRRSKSHLPGFAAGMAANARIPRRSWRILAFSNRRPCQRLAQ